MCFAPAMVMNIWGLIGLFIVRLDGSPRFAMWCNVIPGLLNIVLDYLFIFPLGMRIKGAAIATAISVTDGGVMTMLYLTRFAGTLRLIGVSLSRAGVVTLIKSVAYRCA